MCVSQQSAWTWSLIIIRLYAPARRTSMYSYIPACCYVVCCYPAVAAAVAACCCRSSSCAGWQILFPWFTASDSSVLFSLHTCMAEPRRALTHRGRAPLVYVLFLFLFYIEISVGATCFDLIPIRVSRIHARISFFVVLFLGFFILKLVWGFSCWS